VRAGPPAHGQPRDDEHDGQAERDQARHLTLDTGVSAETGDAPDTGPVFRLLG
jgi:hypothetical protein